MTEQNPSKMTHDEMIDVLKGLVFGTFDRTTAKERDALDMAIKALEQTSCEDAKLISVRQELLDRGDEAVSFRQLVERFEEVEEEYKGVPWNLRQIYNNFNILIGEKPCEDAISRQAVLDRIKEVCFSREQKWVEFRVEYGSNGQRDYIIKFIESLPRVELTRSHGEWIEVGSGQVCSVCDEFQCGHDNFRRFCPHCGADMRGAGCR